MIESRRIILNERMRKVLLSALTGAMNNDPDNVDLRKLQNICKAAARIPPTNLTAYQRGQADMVEKIAKWVRETCPQRGTSNACLGYGEIADEIELDFGQSTETAAP